MSQVSRFNKKKMIILDFINGLSDSKWSGTKNSVYGCCGLDIHSEPGLLKVHQKLKKESGDTVTAFCRHKVSCSNGYSFWFSYTDGKIWARTSAGVWSLAHTTTPAAGSAGCLGAMEYNGFIYWATQSRLHRIAIANADNSWASEAEDWATFTVTDSEFHPMCIQDNRLFIGDGYYVAEVDEDGAFDDDSLNIKTPHRIKCMTDFKLDVLIGTFVANTVAKTEVIQWDTISPSWNTSDTIEEVGINAFIKDDNFVYAQAGRAGNLYFYNGEQLEPYKRIPGTWTNTSYGEVHDGSHANFRGVPIFGFSNGAGNPAKQGVYSLGSYSRDYPKVLDLSWINSQGKVDTQEIGAILVQDFDILVAWKDGTNYGVDVIDWSNKYASSYFETMMLFQNRRDLTDTLRKVSCYYNSLPAGTGITFSYSINGAAYVAMTSVTNSKINEIAADLSADNVGSLQIKVAFTVSGNDSPTLEVPLAIEID